MRTQLARRAAVSLALAFAVQPAGDAWAATGSITGGAYAYWSYSTASGVDSNLTISSSGDRWVFEDTGVTAIIAPAVACRQESSPNIVSCESYDQVPETPAKTDPIIVNLGDGDDKAQVLPSAFRQELGVRISLKGGDGDDFLIGNDNGWQNFTGEAGNDLLVGGAGADSLSGGDGDDILRGGAGADGIGGGNGRDSMSYSSEGRTVGVRAVLDEGATRSGSETFDGGGDLLYTIEDVAGTPYTDVLIGNASNNVLRGNGGADQLTGLAGEDTLIATGGPSWLDGGDGNDSLQAKNTFKDYLGCGNGTDTAKVDPTELFVPFASCETLTS